MAGQETDGDLWDETLGLGLLPPTVCACFRIPPLISMQNVRSRDPCSTKLALDQALCSCMVTHVSKSLNI